MKITNILFWIFFIVYFILNIVRAIFFIINYSPLDIIASVANIIFGSILMYEWVKLK